MLKRYFSEIDPESLLPFMVIASLASLMIRPETTFSCVIIFIATIAVAQFMILTRTLSNPKGERFPYFIANELACAIATGTIVALIRVLV